MREGDEAGAQGRLQECRSWLEPVSSPRVSLLRGPYPHSALHLALSGGMYGAESARWLRRCVRPQQTGRHLLGVWVLHEAVCSDAGALAAGILAQPCELVGLLLRRAG
jgi:hypothetical protein